MKTSRSVNVVITVLIVLAVLLAIYGLRTDCPNTAGYVFCSDSDGWQLWGSRKGGVN